MIDHIVLAATTLDEGVRYLYEQLGVEVPTGGKHPIMGTHNCLMRVGRTIYLEILSIDPSAPPPRRARWFGLDDLSVQARLRERPHFVGWVAQTNNITESIAALGADIGPAIEATRGDLRWRISVRDDGLLLDGGTVPILIEWPEGAHPASKIPDLGIELLELRLKHPSPDWLKLKLRPLAPEPLIKIVKAPSGEPPSLEATFRLPDGQFHTLD